MLTPKRNWKQCLCKILGWQTKSIMVCYGIFWSGQFLCSPRLPPEKTGIIWSATYLFQYWWNYKHHLDSAEPFSGLVSSIFFRLPALLGRVKDFVTMGCLLLAADFPGSKTFLLSQNKQNYICYNIRGVKFLFFRGIVLLWWLWPYRIKSKRILSFL